tara:strand:- start:10808 stop:11410 length:603 start_codon:yes stop_codon:yes gene_type:complete
MDVNSKFKQNIQDIIESKLVIKDGDKIIYFLSEGSNDCLQEIELENYKKDKNSKYFIEDFGERVIIGFYFYLPQDKDILKEYILKAFLNNCILVIDEEYVKESLKFNKNIVTLKISNYEIKYKSNCSQEYYGNIFNKMNNKYIRIDKKHKYNFGIDNFTVYISIDKIIKVIFINCESSIKYNVIDLSSEPIKKIKELKLL